MPGEQLAPSVAPDSPGAHGGAPLPRRRPRRPECVALPASPSEVLLFSFPSLCQEKEPRGEVPELVVLGERGVKVLWVHGKGLWGLWEGTPGSWLPLPDGQTGSEGL